MTYTKDTDDLFTYNAAVPDTGQECRCISCTSKGRYEAPSGTCLWVRVFDLWNCNEVTIRRSRYAADKKRSEAKRKYMSLTQAYAEETA